jgi:hypothetical protein
VAHGYVPGGAWISPHTEEHPAVQVDAINLLGQAFLEGCMSESA